MYQFIDNNIFDPLSNFVEALLAHQGFLAPIFLLILEESGIPLPVPGDVILAYTGYNISRGFVSYPVALIVTMASVLIGSSILYYLSYRWGNVILKRFGKYIHLNPERLALVEKYFRAYGPWVIIFGRHIPGFRIPITFFAGISDVSYKTFILSTFVSTIFWVLFYLELGKRLGPKVTRLFHTPAHWTIIATIIVILVIFILYIRRPTKKK